MSHTSSEQNLNQEDHSPWVLAKQLIRKMLPETIMNGLNLLRNEKRYEELIHQAQDILLFEFYQEPLHNYSPDEIKALGGIDAGELDDLVLRPSKTNRVDFHQTYDWDTSFGGLVILITMTQTHDMAVYQSQAIITSDGEIIT